ELPQAFLGDYIGGRGISAALLYTLVSPDTAARSPKMPLLLAAGPLSGTPAFAATTLTITTRSMLTNSIAHSWTVGAFAGNLESCGYDVLMLMGQAPDWSYLVIDTDGVRVH